MTFLSNFQWHSCHVSPFDMIWRHTKIDDCGSIWLGRCYGWIESSMSYALTIRSRLSFPLSFRFLYMSIKRDVTRHIAYTEVARAFKHVNYHQEHGWMETPLIHALLIHALLIHALLIHARVFVYQRVTTNHHSPPYRCQNRERFFLE